MKMGPPQEERNNFLQHTNTLWKLVYSTGKESTSAILYQVDSFCNFLLTFLQRNLFWKRVYSKSKEISSAIFYMGDTFYNTKPLLKMGLF